MLVTGSVIIGRREEGKEVEVGSGTEPIVLDATSTTDYTDEPDAPPPSVRNASRKFSGEETHEESSDLELTGSNGKVVGESGSR